MGASGEEEPLKDPTGPGSPAIVLERLAHDALLQVIQRTGRGVRLLFHCRQQQRVQFRIFPLDLAGDLTIVRLVGSPASPDYQRPADCRRDERRENPAGPPAGDPVQQRQTGAQRRRGRPAPRETPPQPPPPTIARDGFEMLFEKAINHNSGGRLLPYLHRMRRKATGQSTILLCQKPLQVALSRRDILRISPAFERRETSRMAYKSRRDG